MSLGLAVVTGASSGIGLQLAHVLAFEGYDLIVCSEGDRLDAAVAELKAQGEVQITAVHADLATSGGCRHALEGV